MAYRNMKQRYQEDAVPQLIKELKLDNIMQVPRLEKVTLNMGVGEALNDRKSVEAACKELSLIGCQQAVITHTRKSVASFKIRVGFPIGCKVTLRDQKMYNFLERLIGIAFPRSRDFRGISKKSFDGQGNYNLGIGEHIIFPEIDLDAISKIRGLDIAITTTAANKEQGYSLLKALGFPFDT